MLSFGAVLLASILFGAPLADASSDVALIVIDVQNCFTDGGTLPVEDGEQVVPVINTLRQFFALVIFSQDWHCANHVSFASQYPEHEVFDVVNLQYNTSGGLCRSDEVKLPYVVNCTGETNTLKQTLWPDHCVMTTKDADLHTELAVHSSDFIVQKGYHCHLDSYSAFYDNGQYSETALRQILNEHHISELYFTGLATDYCVYWSATDAKELGFQTYVVLDATRGIDPKSTADAILDMKAKGIFIINSTDVEDILNGDTSQHVCVITTIVCSLLVAFILRI